MIGCTAATAADDGGQGFIALAPDGTQYTFTHLVYRPMSTLTEPLETTSDAVKALTVSGGARPLLAPPSSGNLLERNDAFMYVTQVVDRFGNSLTYTYNNANGNLTSITASDGRSVTVNYDSTGYMITSITANASDVPSRTWTYTYNTSNSALPTLTGVMLPDGSAWSYSNTGALQTDTPQLTGDTADCTRNTIPTAIADPITVTMTHPSGLTAAFNLSTMMHGRSYVATTCWGPESSVTAAGAPDVPYYNFPEYYFQPTITSKSFSGPGIPTETWTYTYSSPNQSYAGDACYSADTCPSTIYTDVLDPNGNDVHYIYSNRWGATEGQLLSTTYYAGAAGGTVLRTETNTYANPTAGPWPSQYGVDLQDRNNIAQTQELSPLQMRQTTEEGDTYTWQAMAYDGYANPTNVKRYNSISGQTGIEETTTFLNDPNLWVLGLTQSVVNNTNGNETELTNTYNSSDLLQSRSHFGEFMMSYTYNSVGQLASFTDGDSNTTNLSNYYRGIPQEIDYPDGGEQTLTVDDLAQISSITDQNGNTTQYTYDPIGRIHQIIYPTNDTVSWFPKTFTYSFVSSAERGIAAGHWDRTTTVGNAVTTTYFDADLRPVLSDTSINGTANSDITTATGYDYTGATTFASYPVSGAPAVTAVTTGTHNIYDPLERVTQTQEDSELGALTTSTAYLAGAGEQVTDPKGNVTTTYYQVFDEPDYKDPILVNAPAGVSQSIVRDIYSNPTSITQSGAYGSENDSITKTLLYDGNHRLCRTTEPESGSTVMAYDGANNLAWSAQGQTITDGTCGQSDVAAAAKTVRTYDPMNRVLSITPPAGTQDTNYSYDLVGNILTLSTGVPQLQSQQQFTYDTRNMLTTEALSVGGYAWALGYTYDGYGHLSAMGYPSYNGTSEGVAYNPDALGRDTQVGSYATGVTYFPNNQVAGFNYGSGASYAAQQNTRQLLSNFSDGVGGTASINEGFAYDANGNITNVNDQVNGQRTKAFTYDALNRLSNATASNLYGTESYTYDALNNLRSRLTGGNALTLNYNANNQLASVSQGASTTTTYGYDNQGNRNSLSSGGVTAAYTFDAENQLLQVSGVESYAYDANGRRVMKTATNGTPTAYYFYDHGGQLMYAFDPATASGTNYMYLGTKLIARHAMQQVAIPTGVTVNPNPNNGNFTVSWNAVPDATSYTMQTTNGTGTTSVVYSGSATSTTQTVTTGGVQFYQLQACSSSGCSAEWPFSVSVWPAIPTISVPSGTDNGGYTVSWTAPAGASTYDLQESVNGGAWTALATNTTALSFSQPGNVSGTYTYRVEAFNRQVAGTAGWATSPVVTVNTSYGVVPTPTPTLTVPATSHNGNATISWTAAASVTGYTLQQSSNGGSTWTTAYSGTSTSIALTGLATGSYSYQLKACNTAGGGSACTSFVTGGPMVVTLPPSPAPSAQVQTQNSTNGTYIVSWLGNNEATSYTVDMEVNNSGNWTPVQSGTGTAYDAVGQTDATYDYRVEACNVAGCSPWSNIVMTSVLLPPASPPSLSGGGTSTTGSYGLTWNAVANATSYELQQNLNGNVTVEQNTAATSWSVSGQADGTYAYAVYACNTSGCSSGSNLVTETVSLIPVMPSAPFSITETGSSSKMTVHLSWGAIANATSYTLQMMEPKGDTAWMTQAGVSGTTWSDLILYSGEVEFRLQACNSLGCSAWSSPQDVELAN
jgi:YD repeat-containing protein